MDNRKNVAFLVGYVGSPFQPWGEANGTKFYSSILLTERKSGVQDKVPIIVPKDNICSEGTRLLVRGEYRTNPEIGTDNARHLYPHIFAKDVRVAEERDNEENILILRANVGYVAPARTTPQGRTVCEIRLFVESGVGACAVPCICWEKLIPTAESLKAGDKVFVKGRFQSRSYNKELADKTIESKTAYEVSVWSLMPGWNNEAAANSKEEGPKRAM